jgi:dTDP-4-amino-4,6-dideoxygalactose transaminase
VVTVAEVAGITISNVGVVDSTPADVIKVGDTLTYTFAIKNVVNYPTRFRIPNLPTTTGPVVAGNLSYSINGSFTKIPGTEVITSAWTMAATATTLLHWNVVPVFADIDRNTFCLDPKSVIEKITKKTKAIVCVHYGGLPCDLKELQELASKFKIPLIEDAAHALGAEYNNKKIGSVSDFTIFSFQAIKHITTGDGGALCIKNNKLLEKAKRLRWFGIDRKKKQLGIWENDIKEIGYKYQLSDLGATLGYESLLEFKKILKHRRDIYQIYLDELQKNKNIICVHEESKIKKHAAWFFTILTDQKDFLQKKLRSRGIETNQVHFRNDKYSIFKQFVKNSSFPNMDYIEDKYLVLPVHTKMSLNDAVRVAKEINRIL